MISVRGAKGFMSNLKKIPDWNSFKALGRSKIIRTSYWWLFLVPLLAKLLEATGDELTLNIFDAELTITLNLPFSWVLFYFSAVSFSIASLIYITRCPRSADKYDDYEEWKKSGKDSTSLIRAYLFAYRNDKMMFPYQISDVSKNYFLKHYLEYKGDFSKITKKTNTPSVLLKSGIPEGGTKAVYYHVADTIKRSNVYSRLFMLMFYVIGFVCFTAVLVQNFIYVCKYL
jgi:hypothetical protein